MRLLELFPGGVEEVEGGYAVYVDETSAGALAAGPFELGADTEVDDGWEDNWRKFHHGVVVGRFWVGPPWEAPPEGAEAIVVDPGRAFGTGAHPTTRLTLELLQEQAPSALLDVGCGSGVLSIAAAKLGFAPVLAVDVDEAAVEATLANARLNRVEVAARRADALTDVLPPADLVLANVALGLVERLLARSPARRVVASGYLEQDEPHAPGWRREARRASEGWAADLLVRSDS